MSKTWFKAALIRALRTFAQSALAYIGSSAVILSDVNWVAAVSAGALGAVISILMSTAGLLEAPEEDDEDE